MPLLERADVLASLGEYLRCAQGGAGRLAFVAGEAGVGKTAVLEAFERGTSDVRWGHGVCDGLFTPRPLGPLFDIAADLGGPLLDACRRGAPRDELFGVLLEQLAAVDGVAVLSIEDVHWADEASLDLLSFLGRRIDRLPVLALVTYRQDELAAAHPLRFVIGELAAKGSTRRIEIAPLSRVAVDSLAADSAVDAAELYRLTGGNAFFVTEVLQAGVAGVPASARAAVLARTSRLSRSARRVVEAAALIGASIDLAVLDSMAGPTADDLDELVDLGVIVSDQAGLRFRHEITRLAVEREIPAHRRRPMHAAALAALVSSGCSDEARLSYHADGAEDADAVLRFAPAAAARASKLGSHREAAAQYERSIRFADQRDPASLAELYDLLVKENSLTDTWDRAAEAGERALALWRQIGDKHRQGATMAQLSRTMWRLCRPGWMQYAEDALAMLEPLGPSPELAWAYANSAQYSMQTGGARERGVGLARKAQALATELGLPDVLSDALNTEACLLSDRSEAWQPLIERALDVAIEAGAQEQAGRAYVNICELLLEQGSFTECEKYCNEGTQYCDEQDLGTSGFCLRGERAAATLLQGRWDETVAIARSVLSGEVSSPANRIVLAIPIGLVLARRGDAEAWTYLDEALTNSINSGDEGWLVETYPAHAEAHWLTGDLDAARADLAAAASRAHDMLGGLYNGRLAAWYRRLGMDAPDLRLADHDPVRNLFAGDFSAAATGWDELGMPYEAALAYYDSGTEEGLREAVRRFEALGAVAAVDATRREMRRIGVRSIPSGARTATRAHPIGLTRREAEVLDLLSAGRTNAEMAQQLVVSERTVEHHVSAVLAKLGVRSRSAATIKAGRLGLIGAPRN